MEVESDNIVGTMEKHFTYDHETSRFAAIVGLTGLYYSARHRTAIDPLIALKSDSAEIGSIDIRNDTMLSKIFSTADFAFLQRSQLHVLRIRVVRSPSCESCPMPYGKATNIRTFFPVRYLELVGLKSGPGSMAIDFFNGASVTLEGPAEFQIVSVNKVFGEYIYSIDFATILDPLGMTDESIGDY